MFFTRIEQKYRIKALKITNRALVKRLEMATTLHKQEIERVTYLEDVIRQKQPIPERLKAEKQVTVLQQELERLRADLNEALADIARCKKDRLGTHVDPLDRNMISERDKQKQRISFAYGNLKIHDVGVTREDLEEAAKEYEIENLR